MASLQPTLTDPDKLGLLIQCRQKMDELNTKQLNEYAHSTFQLLSTQQLKSLIFVGLNSIKNDISYSQLFKMRSSINQIIEQAKKLKNKKKPNLKSEDKKPLILIPIIPKNVSLTKIIPFDIISNNICRFLKMSSITKLAQCDRKLAIICHTPTSITNLMHRYDSYQYVETQEDIMIDGYYESVRDCNLSNLHRFKNVERLSIDLQYLASNDKIEKLNLFGRVKYLSFFDVKSDCELYPFDGMKLMTNLKRISFINIASIINIIYLLKPYKSNKTNNPDASKSYPYYNQIIYQLRSIVFIDCDFSDTYYEDIISEYKNLLHFLLPAQPNNLQVVKFENSYFAKTDHPECKEANVAFNNIERIKTSLLNLKGFVFAESEYEEDDNPDFLNIYFNLTRNILSNLIYFKYLKSIHTHSSDEGLLSLYLNNNNINALNKVTELCISISMNQNSTSLLRNLKPFVPNLQKLCLVINISDDTPNTSHFEKIMKSIFGNQTKLKLFQIVIIIKDDENMDEKFCAKKLNILSESIKKLIKLLKSLRNHFNSKRSLLFKFHVKLSHSELDAKCLIYPSVEVKTFGDMIQTLIIHYLMTYPFGKIQFKYSWNIFHHNCIRSKFENCMNGLDGLFKVSVKSGGCLEHLSDEIDQVCHNDMDFKQYAISITKKNIVDEGVEYENKWNVDCRYCCNTPWL